MEKLKKLFPNIDSELLLNYQLDPNDFETAKGNYFLDYSYYVLIERATGDQYIAKSNLNKIDFHIERELKANLNISNKFMVKFKGFWINTMMNETKIYLIYDKCLMHPLREILDMDDTQLNKISWNDTKKLIFIYGVAAGMSLLHSKGFLHRNLNPDTIFLNDNLYPKIGDFGTSQKSDTDFFARDTFQEIASICMPPEFFEDYEQYSRTQGIDVYSFGLILYEIMTNQKPFGEKPTVADVVDQIKKELRPEFTDSVPECYRNLISRCWAQDPKDRPTFEDIVKELITNPDFITDSVNKEEFNAYIEYTKDPESFAGNCENDEIQTEQKTKHLSLDLEETDLSVYEKLQNVGQGSFGKVYKVRETATGNIHACKISMLELNAMSDESIGNMERELTVMSKIKHPSIVEFIGYNKENFKKQPRPTIITEFIPNGSLDIILSLERKGHSGTYWNDTKKLITIYGIAHGMSYLHSQNILHRDLKPGSIFIDEFLFPKIGEFGKSYIFSGEECSVHLKHQEGTAAYLSPEIINEDLYCKAGDVYAFGMIVYEIMTAEVLYQKMTPLQIQLQVPNGIRPKFEGEIPQSYKDLIESCWQNNPSERPTFEDIVSKLENEEGFLIDTINDDEYFKYIDALQDIQKGQESGENNAYQNIMNTKFDKIQIDQNLAKSDGEIEDETAKNKVKKRSHRSKKVQFISKSLNLSIDLKETDLSFYKKIQNLGLGTFGHVYKVIDTTTGNICMCKASREDIDYMSDKKIQNLEQELTVMPKIKHPSIVEFIGYNKKNFRKQPRPTIITEFIPNGSLDIILSLERKGLSGTYWNDTKKLITIYGIAHGMSYLHSQNILHRDLKPGNIFIDEFLFPKIGEFGKSYIFSGEECSVHLKHQEGTAAYLSPEIINEDLYCKAGDVYAFGMIVYEIMTAEVLYKGQTMSQILHQVPNGIRPKFEGEIPQSYKDLIESCWQNNPSERPTFEEIVSKLENEEGFIIDTIDEDEYFKYIDALQDIQKAQECGENNAYQNIMSDNFDKIQIDLSMAEN